MDGRQSGLMFGTTRSLVRGVAWCMMMPVCAMYYVCTYYNVQVNGATMAG